MILGIEPGFTQVAGVLCADEVRLIASTGPEAIGVPYALEGRKEELTHEQFLEVMKAIPTSTLPLWITYLEDAATILDFAKQSRPRGIQLHGEATPELFTTLRQELPDCIIIKSLIVGRDCFKKLETDLVNFSPFVDAFLTDTWEPSTGKSGATGKTHDWSVSRRLVEISARPVLLAGGLTPENVAEAIAATKPWGVDSHTGLESSDGKKDMQKMKQFLTEARRAFAAYSPTANR